MEISRPTIDKPNLGGPNLISGVKWQIALKQKEGVKQGLGTWSKTCPSAPPSTTNPTWAGLGQNLGLRGGRPAINRL